MRLEYAKEAVRTMRRLNPKLARALQEALARIAADPFARHSNVERLAGTANGFRLRHGNWRAVYRVDVEAQAVFVERIKQRGEVYKR